MDGMDEITITNYHIPEIYTASAFNQWLYGDPSDSINAAIVEQSFQVFHDPSFDLAKFYNEVIEHHTFRYSSYHSYYESLDSGSPSSQSCSSADEVPPPPQYDKDVARSSGRNQLGRTYSPGLPLPMNVRETIVKLFQAGWKICDISKKLCVTHSCVSKILQRYQRTGSVKPKDAKEGRAESALVTKVREYYLRLGMERQCEIREQLISDGLYSRDTAPSRSSINHILRTKLDVKRRKKAIVPT